MFNTKIVVTIFNTTRHEKVTPTWSVSRDRILHNCERRYYFQYLASARINSRNATSKEIAFLKKLQTIPMWQGEVFHAVVANCMRRIRRGESLLSDTWLIRLKKKVEHEWAFSESKSFRAAPQKISKDGGLALFEHEYDEELKQQSCATIIDSIETWVKRFATWVEQTDLTSSVQRAKQVWIEPQIYGANAPGFMVNNVQVIAKVDLAFLSRNGKFQIFDWKTGMPSLSKAQQPSQAELQIGVYQLWSHLSLKHPLENIQAHLVYFGSEPAQEQVYYIDQNSVESTIGLIRRSISRVLRFGNKEGEITLNLEDFDFASYPEACHLCSFKRICQRILEA